MIPTLSGEIRQRLTVISGRAQLMVKRLASYDNEVARQLSGDVQAIIVAAKGIEELIEVLDE